MKLRASRLAGSVATAIVLVVALGSVVEARAGVPLGLLPQRRGRMVIPPPPTPVDSSAQIDILNKALRALGSTDRDYDGHRQKAIEHIALAIQHLQLPNARGKSNATIAQAARGKAPAVTKTATTPQAASDEAMHKAKMILFNAHHQLADHTASRGMIKADAQVRTAIDEIVAALAPKPAKPATPAATAATTPVHHTTSGSIPAPITLESLKAAANKSAK